MQFKNKLYFIVLLSQQKRTSKYIKVLINKMHKITNLRYETQSPLNKKNYYKNIIYIYFLIFINRPILENA